MLHPQKTVIQSVQKNKKGIRSLPDAFENKPGF
jgi:hypothetical protein